VRIWARQCPLSTGCKDLVLIDKDLRSNTPLVIASASPGLPLTRLGPRNGVPQLGIRLLHPDCREIFVLVPGVNELEQALVS